MNDTNLASAPARRPLFTLGDIVSTPGALRLLAAYDLHPIRLLARHVHGDWGDVCAADAQANDQAVGEGARLLSAYTLPGGERLWVLTESDRSVTTLLLPDEY